MKIFNKYNNNEFLKKYILLDKLLPPVSLETFIGDLLFNENIRLNQCYYLIFLIDVTNILNNFILNITKNEKSYYAWSHLYGQDPGSIFIVNGINHDNHIYFSLGEFCFQNNNGYVGQNPNSTYLNDVQTAIHSILKEQEELRKNENYKDHILHIKETPQSLLQKFLPCFIENIYDIPKDSILWETALLKETMTNYEALKKYAEDRGWL